MQKEIIIKAKVLAVTTQINDHYVFSIPELIPNQEADDLTYFFHYIFVPCWTLCPYC